MRWTRYWVYYPNGNVRQIMASNPDEAYSLAMERWGTPPQSVIEDDHSSE